MTINLLIKKPRIENKEFITSDELKTHCKATGADYTSAVRYFIKKKYVIRIFRGIFYLRSLEEIKLGRTKYNHLELVSKGLEIKKVRNWYFGLHTALKHNNMTHEHLSIEDVIENEVRHVLGESVASADERKGRNDCSGRSRIVNHN